MHIKKIELQGFKSFPERTAFHFGPGISGVVGPNGCGKSNVVDAVKWCLGEQSARSLRGHSMQDVIFAGSEGRAPMGLAEVVITFAAGEQPFPGDYGRHAEIAVSRRLTRDGQSEYQINGQRSRLKDIQDLFLDSGAANRLYSFIEQGRIDQIVAARPEQRRLLIEEAAGIARYKLRREEAEQKLSGTEENLGQVQRTLDELSQRRKGLERQVGRAWRHRLLRSAVRQGEVLLGMVRFAGLSEDRRALLEKGRELDSEEGGARREVERREVELGRQREALETRELDLGRMRDRLAELEASRREQESARLYQAREKGELDRRLTQLSEQQVEALRQVAQSESRRAELDREQGDVARTRADVAAELEKGHREVGEAEQAVRARRDSLDAARAAVNQVGQERAGLEAELKATSSRRAELEERGRKVSTLRNESGSGLSRLERDLADQRSQALSAEQRSRELATAAAEARTRLSEAQARLPGAQQALTEAQRLALGSEREEARLRARLDSLSALQASGEGVEESARRHIGQAGVLGIFADLLDVPQELEARLSLALDGALDCLVVQDVATAERLLRAGPLRVFVVTDDAGAELPGWEGLGGRPGALGLVRALLRAQRPVRSVAEALLGGRALIEGELSALCRGHGELVRPGSGGAGLAILARRRAIAQLGQELAQVELQNQTAQAALVERRQAVDLLQRELKSATEAEQGARQQAGEAGLRERDLKRQVELGERERERMAQALARVSQELTEIAAGMAALGERLDGLKRSLGAAHEARQQAEDRLKDEQISMSEDNRRLGAARESLGRLATRAAALAERAEGLIRALQETQRAEQGFRRQVVTLEAEQAAARARVAEILQDEVRLIDVLATLGAEQASQRALLDEERAKVKSAREELGRGETAVREARLKREKIAGQRAELERKHQAIKEELGRVRDQLDERYSLSPAALLDRIESTGFVVIEVDPALHEADLPTSASARSGEDDLLEDLRLNAISIEDEKLVRRWVEQVQACRTELQALGEVNLVALAEYREVTERWSGLEGQRVDLDQAVQSLKQTIARLNRTCRERFRETFDRVDGFFQEIYPRLVGGGKARLMLINDEDVLESGVDIIAQPPGKKLQSLSLLSGGETAMVAISFLFSLFRVKPSPFCLLDEVDAPLDEGNGGRFNGMLREMAELAQFIVITHNKKTMECADTLYGVTMPTPGVSRLVSVRLE